MLVAHTHANWVLSDIKLAVDEAAGDEAVTILHALGTPDEQIVEVAWADLDRTIDADHLTSLWIPNLAAPVGAAYVRFHALTRTLREQCPWDIEQTHDSLIPHLLEETYEVVDAIHALDDAGTTATDQDSTDPGADPDADLIEELGDLLYQIEFHATIAEQEGRFTIADVANGIHDKLVRRHPHVFGHLVGNDLDTAEVLSNWDDIKRDEKSRTSVFDGIPRSMPALAYAAKVGSKASKVGFDWPDVGGAFPKIAEETAELHEAMHHPDDDDRQRCPRRRTRRSAVRHRQRRPPPAHRPGTRAARRDRQVPRPFRRRRTTRTGAVDRAARRRTRNARRALGRGQGHRVIVRETPTQRRRRSTTGDASGPGAGCAANASSVCSHSLRQRSQRSSMTSSNTVVARHVAIANINAGTP